MSVIDNTKKGIGYWQNLRVIQILTSWFTWLVQCKLKDLLDWHKKSLKYITRNQTEFFLVGEGGESNAFPQIGCLKVNTNDTKR